MQKKIKFPNTVEDFAVSKECFQLKMNAQKDLLVTTPTPENLSKYYPRENYISHSGSKASLLDRVYQRVKQQAHFNKERMLFNLLQKKGAHLDYGAGNGSFVNYMIKNNWKSRGVEPSEYAREMALKESLELMPNMESLGNNEFDLITLWHVLEHIPNYEEIITQLYHKIIPGGYLVLGLPNFKSWDAHHYSNYWAAYDVPRHLFHFTKESIKRISREHDFEFIDCKAMWFDAFYVSILSEKNKKSKAPFLKGICIGAISNLMGLRNKEFSSHVYLLRKPKNT